MVHFCDKMLKLIKVLMVFISELNIYIALNGKIFNELRISQQMISYLNNVKKNTLLKIF